MKITNNQIMIILVICIAIAIIISYMTNLVNPIIAMLCFFSIIAILLNLYIQRKIKK